MSPIFESILQSLDLPLMCVLQVYRLIGDKLKVLDRGDT
jgi:hypothetical protein